MSSNGTDLPKTNGTEVKQIPEPTECDPCMEDTKDQKSTGLFQKYRDEISDRTGLSHKGVYVVGTMVIFACLLFVVVVALAAAWPNIPHRYRFPVCKEAACLRGAAQIREALNSSVSPCENLWEATCGGWLRKYPLPKDMSIWNQKQQLVRKEAERVRDLITTLALPLHINTVEWKMKYLYEACMNVDSIDSEKATPLTKIISELGGWYILKDWSELNFDKDLLLLKLQVDYGVSPFFKISVEPNPNMPGHNVIRISPSGLGLPDKEYYYRDEDDRIMTAYKEYIRDVVIYLSTARNEATKFGTDIFSYEKRIAEVTPDNVNLQNPITTFNAISISELKETNLIPFFDILQAMYPESNISENTEVVVTSLEYLGQIAQIMATTDRRTMNGYLIWTLVRKYIPFVSSKYTSAVDTFNSELLGLQKPLDRWEMCSRLVQRFMGLATTNFMERNNPITTPTAQLVNGIFSSIVRVVERKILTFQKTELLYNHLKLKLSKLRLEIGLSKNLTDEKYLKSYYSTLRIIKSNFFDSVRSSIELERKLEARKLLKSPAEDSILTYMLAETPRVAYSPSEHAVVIPRSLLVEPFFEPNFPSSIIYGRLGVEIAEAVLSSILPYNSLWTADKKILSPFHVTADESVRSVVDVTKCISDYILNLNLAIPAVTANETALKTLIHLSATQVAHEALAITSEKTEHIHEPALEEFESSALFFLVYAQTQCAESTSQYQLYENMVHFELPQRSRLHLVWTQLPDFAESLECNYNKKLRCRNNF